MKKMYLIMLSSIVGLSLVTTNDLFSQRRGRRSEGKPDHSEMGVDTPRGGGRGKPHHSEHGVETPRGRGGKMAGMSAEERKKHREERRKRKEALKKIFAEALKYNRASGIEEAELDFQKWPVWFMAVNTFIRAYKEKKSNVSKALIEKGLDVKEFGKGRRGRHRGRGRGHGRGHGKGMRRNDQSETEDSATEDDNDGDDDGNEGEEETDEDVEEQYADEDGEEG